MKILVMGSVQDPKEKEKVDQVVGSDYEAYKQQFQAAAVAIGQALAEKGHTIIVTAVSWETVNDGAGVARYVVQGASKAKPPAGKLHTVLFYAPRDPEPGDRTSDVADTLLELRALPNIDIRDAFSEKRVRISYGIADVREADAVIVVDGSAGVEQVAYAAYYLRKPVIPLAFFGNMPGGLYKKVGPGYEYLADCGDISARELRSMSMPWLSEQEDKQGNNLNTAKVIVGLAERLVAISVRAERQNTTGLLATIALTVLPILVWVWAFTSSYIKSQEWSFFFVLFLSVLPGVGLRMLVSYQQGSTARLTWRGLLVDVAVAIVIAFGLALLFLIGNIAFTGQLAVNFAEGNIGDFARVAVIMSILGLTAGYLVPLGRLRELLENSLAQQR